MMIRNLIAACSLLAMSEASVAGNLDWIISFDGLGPIKVGMTVSEAEQASHMKFNQYEPNNECYTVKPKGHKGLSFMVKEGRIVRVDIENGDFATSKGTKVGDKEEDVKADYSNELTVEPHKYVDNGHYLTVEDKANHTAIRFDTNGKEVVSIHSGGADEVYLVEGCL